jgi:uncharacterized membrane protein
VLTDLNTAAAVAAVLVALITLYGTIRVTQIVVRAMEAGRSARTMLDRRLARGEITTEEYFELESALRSGAPVAPPRRRALKR